MHSERGADRRIEGRAGPLDGWTGLLQPKVVKVQESRWLVRPEYDGRTRVSKLAKLVQLASKPSTEFNVWSRPSRWRPG